MSHEVEQMFSARETPWHRIGVVTKEALTSEEALVTAGLDWNVVKMPIYTDSEIKEPIPGYWANVRDKDNKVLGVVGDRYKIVQNKEAFAFVDHLLKEGVKFETAGSLFGGRTVWMMGLVPQKYKIINDQIAPYLAFVNTFDGSGSIKVIMTATRIVCNNTLNIALNDAKRSWTCIHAGNIEGKLAEARKTLVLAENYMEKLIMESERLHNTMMYRPDVEGFIEDLFPIPDDAGTIAENNILELRVDLKNRFYAAPDLKRLENSAYKMLNAVSDFALHRQPQRKTDTYAESNFDKLLSGHPLIDQAYAILAEMAV